MSPSITPGQARRLIQENVAEAAGEIVEFGGEDYMNVLQRMADLGLESGAVCDALHVQCAEKVSADEVRTFNGKDFRRMPPGGGTDLVVL
jgi:predicted nucleic acid-binding protein